MSRDFDPFTGEPVDDDDDHDYWYNDEDSSRVTCWFCKRDVPITVIVKVDRDNALHRAKYHIFEDYDTNRLRIKNSFPTSPRHPYLICCDDCKEEGRLNSLIRRYTEYV